jgi:hypothetical protein
MRPTLPENAPFLRRITRGNLRHSAEESPAVVTQKDGGDKKRKKRPDYSF